MSHEQEMELRDRVRAALVAAVESHRAAQHISSTKVKVTEALFDSLAQTAVYACFPEEE